MKAVPQLSQRAANPHGPRLPTPSHVALRPPPDLQDKPTSKNPREELGSQQLPSLDKEQHHKPENLRL